MSGYSSLVRSISLACDSAIQRYNTFLWHASRAESLKAFAALPYLRVKYTVAVRLLWVATAARPYVFTGVVICRHANRTVLRPNGFEAPVTSISR